MTLCLKTNRSVNKFGSWHEAFLSIINTAALIMLGMLLTFAFAPYYFYLLAIIVPAILLLFWIDESPKASFWQGFYFGLGYFGLGVYWIFISIHEYGDVPTTIALIITSGAICILAFYPGIVGYLLNRYFAQNYHTKMVYAFPAIWVSVEWARSWLLTGFTWLFLGYSQTNSPLKGYAPLLSVYGVSIAVCLSSGLLAYAIIKLHEKNYRALFSCSTVIFAIWLAGGLLDQIAWTKSSGKPIPVSLVQGNIPQHIKWSPLFLQLSLDRYEELTQPLWGKSKIIIWPESAIPMTLQDADDYVARLDAKAKESGSQLLLGVPILSETENGYYNAIISVGADKQIYYKRHLVPFGEYVPFGPWLFNFLNFMKIPVSVLIPGQLFQPPLKIGNENILPSICYEITFPELIYTDDKNISFLLTVTNDAWFGKSNAQAQHLQMAAMRAIEFRRPILMASNDGITALVSPQGKIQAAAPTHDDYVLNVSVQARYGLTPWMRNGIDSVLFILLCLFYIAVRRTRTQKSSNVNVAYNQN